MAIPKGEFFKDKVEQGRYGPIFPKSPAWLYDHREIEPDARRLSAPMGRRSKKRSPVRNSWCLYKRISAVGPEVGVLFPVGQMQGSLNLRGYWEFCGSKPIVRLEYMVGVFNCADRQSAKGRQINYCEWRGILISWVIQQRCEKGKPCASARSSTSIFVRIGFYPRSR